MSLNHLYEPTTPAASEIVRAIRVMDGPAAIELLRDAMDMAYLKGKMDGVNDGIAALRTGLDTVLSADERAANDLAEHRRLKEESDHNIEQLVILARGSGPR
jgi:hypothetical protein